MKISDFINDELFNLPKERPDDIDFKDYVFKIFELFLDKISELKKTEKHFDNLQQYPLERIYERQTHFLNKLKKTIDNYYNGKPAAAYKRLTEGLVSKSKDFQTAMYKHKFPCDENFYRIRISTENYAIPQNEFFHIPFHLRRKIQTQRFSIPGFPSLYLGTTVYICWEELGRPNINNFQVVRLQNTESIRVLNLVPPIESYRSPERLYAYLMLWPLIFASSIKVNNRKDSFKPEYIIPQLLMQWIRNRDDLDGIMYQTTHIDFNKFDFKGQFVNVVLPVKENKTEGLCDSLRNKFKMTAATSIPLYESSSGNTLYIGTFDKDPLDDKIQKLKIIKGHVYPYDRFILGKLENILINMETNNI